MTVPPAVHLLAGLNGAGKSTHARRLEHELPAVRFSLDAHMLRTHGLSYDHPDYPVLAEQAKQALWGEALTALATGSDVVLDWNQWSRSRRATWADRAEDAGYAVVVHVIRVPLDTAIGRALARGSGPDGLDHVLDEEAVRHLAAMFEEPSPDEGHELRVVDAT